MPTFEEWAVHFEATRRFSHSTERPDLRPIKAEFKPHQLKPLALLNGAAAGRAVLIADEVGTGKTYAAGHIIRDVFLNRPAPRIIILGPARLISTTWKPTLRTKFGLTNTREIYNGKGLQKWLLGEDNASIVACSYMKARAGADDDGPDLLSELRQAESLGRIRPIDLLVVDEIHNLFNEAHTDRALCEIIRNFSTTRVATTATPVYFRGGLQKIYDFLQPVGHGNGTFQSDLKEHESRQRLALRLESKSMKELNLGEVKEIKTLVGQTRFSSHKDEALAIELRWKSPLATWMTRTRTVDVPNQFHARRSVRLEHPAEDFSEQPGKERWNKHTGAWEQKPSAKDLYEQILSELGPTPRSRFESCPAAACASPQDWPGGVRVLLEGLNEVLHDGNEGPADPKYTHLTSLIKRFKESGKRGVIVYSHWKTTQSYLSEKLKNEDGWKSFYATHLEAKEEAFERNIQDFTENCAAGHFSVLVASSGLLKEGRDLQSADCMVFYDVYGNALAYEQLIGRIDRIGQTAERLEIVYLVREESGDHFRLVEFKERLSKFYSTMGRLGEVVPPDLDSRAFENMSSDRLRLLQDSQLEVDLEEIQSLDLGGFEPASLPVDLEYSTPDWIEKGLDQIAKETAERLGFPVVDNQMTVGDVKTLAGYKQLISKTFETNLDGFARNLTHSGGGSRTFGEKWKELMLRIWLQNNERSKVGTLRKNGSMAVASFGGGRSVAFFLRGDEGWHQTAEGEFWKRASRHQHAEVMWVDPPASAETSLQEAISDVGLRLAERDVNIQRLAHETASIRLHAQKTREGLSEEAKAAIHEKIEEEAKKSVALLQRQDTTHLETTLHLTAGEET